MLLFTVSTSISESNNSMSISKVSKIKPMTGISCDSYVPFDYDKDISAASETVVDFEYRITNFDVVDTEDYVSCLRY